MIRLRRTLERGRRHPILGPIVLILLVLLLAMVMLTVTFFLLNAIQSVGLSSAESRDVFLPVAFEAVSAFSTTGLSMNYTHHLHTPAQVFVILLMFIGRVGLLSFFAAATLRRGITKHTRPAQEDVMVG